MEAPRACDRARRRSPAPGWATAVSATLHCLTGCAIGEVLGMVLATWWGWGDVPSILLAVVLAFFFGYLPTSTPARRHGLTPAAAVRVAIAAGTVSILAMELIDKRLHPARARRDLGRPGRRAVLVEAGRLAGDRVHRDRPGEPPDDRARQGHAAVHAMH